MSKGLHIQALNEGGVSSIQGSALCTVMSYKALVWMSLSLSLYIYMYT